MEIWFLFALISGIFSGGVAFLNKVSAHHNQNSVFVSFYSSLGGLFLGIILFMIYGKTSDINLATTLFGIFSGVFVYLGLIFRIKSLKYIDTTVFFPLYKTFGPLIVIFVSLFIFFEKLNLLEAFGLFLGLLVPLFILNKDNIKSREFKKGLFFLIFCVLCSIVPGYLGKVIYNEEFSILFYLLMVNITGTLIAIFHGNKMILDVNKSKYFGIGVGLIGGILYFLSGFFFVSAMQGNLAVVYSINSFSFLIPIILSIIFYKEDISLKKILAIVFTLISLYLMK